MPRWPKRKPRPGVDEYGRTPLWYHALNGDLDGVRAALLAGADPSAGDDVNYTPLHAAVQEGRVEAARFLLVAGTDPGRPDDHGNGPLWTAALSAPVAVRAELVALLLAAGADPGARNRYGLSPREAAAGRGLPVSFDASASKPAEPGAAPDTAG